jgi:hypothetical protein
VVCFVYGRAPYGAPQEVHESTGLGTVRLTLENLACTIFFIGGKRDDEGVQRLRSAFDNLR